MTDTINHLYWTRMEHEYMIITFFKEVTDDAIV